MFVPTVVLFYNPLHRAGAHYRGAHPAELHTRPGEGVRGARGTWEVREPRRSDGGGGGGSASRCTRSRGVGRDWVRATVRVTQRAKVGRLEAVWASWKVVAGRCGGVSSAMGSSAFSPAVGFHQNNNHSDNHVVERNLTNNSNEGNYGAPPGDMDENGWIIDD